MCAKVRRRGNGAGARLRHVQRLRHAVHATAVRACRVRLGVNKQTRRTLRGAEQHPARHLRCSGRAKERTALWQCGERMTELTIEGWHGRALELLHLYERGGVLRRSRGHLLVHRGEGHRVREAVATH